MHRLSKTCCHYIIFIGSEILRILCDVYVLMNFYLHISRYTFLFNNVHKTRVYIRDIFVLYHTDTRRLRRNGKNVGNRFVALKQHYAMKGLTKFLSSILFREREKKNYMVNKLSPNCIKVQSN